VCRVGPAPHDAGPPSEPDVHLSMHPAQAIPGESGDLEALRSALGGSSAGPRTAAGGRGVSFVRWLRRRCHRRFRGSPDHVSSLSRPGTRPGIRPVIRDGRLEGATILSRFPLPFGRRRSLLGHPVPAGELSSPRGRLTGRPGGTGGPRRGFHVSHAQAATGVGALYIPGTTVLTRAGHDHQLASAASQRLVPAPRHNHHPCEALLDETSTKGSSDFTRPVFPSPVTPGWNGRPWAFPRASHPTLTGDARRGGDRPSSTSLKHALRHQPNLQPRGLT
jgi:hypothetical protein